MNKHDLKVTDDLLVGEQKIANGQSFRTQLVKRLTIASVTLAIISAFVYSYFSSHVVKDFYQSEGLQAAENFAHLSELAILYDSGENGREAAIATLNFPTIKHVAIISNDGTILFGEGDTSDPILNTLDPAFWSGKNAQIVERNENTWQIAAPVFTGEEYASDADVLIEEAFPPEYIGYVAVQVDASEVQKAQNRVFFQNLLIGFSYGLTFLLVVSAALGRLLKPMSKLADVMDQSKEGDYIQAEIDSDASLEVQTMSGAYNKMISALSERDHRLRSQKDLLETEVALRTSELTHARDAALEANRHKSEFLANVTHELRTPLQSILGYAELLSECLEDEGIDEYGEDIEKITRNANHLLGLINSILDISKIEAGKMDVHAEKTDISTVVSSAAETVKHLIEQNQNQLEIDMSGISGNIYIDGNKVFQILLNLLSNAAKFTQNGTITIAASTSNAILTISVRDTGIGMSKDQQNVIFEPFRQLDGSESRKFVGTGLGLSIVLRLTEILGGQVHIDSELNVGSCFTIELPVEQEEKNYQCAV